MNKGIPFILIGFTIISCKHREHGLIQEGNLQTLIFFQDTASLMKLSGIKAVGSEKNIVFSLDSLQVSRSYYLRNDSINFRKDSMPCVISEIALDVNKNGVVYYFYTDEIDTLKLTYNRDFKYESQYELYYGNISIAGHTFKKAIIKNRYPVYPGYTIGNLYELVLEIEK